MQHKKGFIMVLAIFLLICLLLNTMSSCSMMAQSIGSMISGTTYLRMTRSWWRWRRTMRPRERRCKRDRQHREQPSGV